MHGGVGVHFVECSLPLIYWTPGQLVAEGKVLHRADIQPTDSSVYMKLKRLASSHWGN